MQRKTELSAEQSRKSCHVDRLGLSCCAQINVIPASCHAWFENYTRALYSRGSFHVNRNFIDP